ncbi:MAG: hypothetical protein Q9165_002131 [Trypethelium subeluteriae]
MSSAAIRSVGSVSLLDATTVIIGGGLNIPVPVNQPISDPADKKTGVNDGWDLDPRRRLAGLHQSRTINTEDAAGDHYQGAMNKDE